MLLNQPQGTLKLFTKHWYSQTHFGLSKNALYVLRYHFQTCYIDIASYEEQAKKQTKR